MSVTLSPTFSLIVTEARNNNNRLSKVSSALCRSLETIKNVLVNNSLSKVQTTQPKHGTSLFSDINEKNASPTGFNLSTCNHISLYTTSTTKDQTKRYF